MSSSEPRRRPGVLVVEDSDLIRAIVVRLIEEGGEFRVIGEARTGFEAIHKVHEFDPDLVTLDLEMPDLGGHDTLGYIMSEAPRPVVILSSHGAAGAEPALRALDLGAVEVVPDKQGRILIPPSLRSYAGLDRDVVITGMPKRFEIWSREKWEVEVGRFEKEGIEDPELTREIDELGI